MEPGAGRDPLATLSAHALAQLAGDALRVGRAVEAADGTDAGSGADQRHALRALGTEARGQRRSEAQADHRREAERAARHGHVSQDALRTSDQGDDPGALPMSALFALLLVAAPGDAPLLKYTTKVMTKSWEPIEIPEVERFLEAEVLQILTAPGTVRLEKSGFADLQTGDYSLLINGRFIEEAERFSVYLTFGKGKRTDLPSFHAAHTSDALGKKPRSEMQRLISAAASSAAKRMIEVLAPQLEAARLKADPPVLEDPELPTDWGTIDIPRVQSKDKAIQTLLDVRNPDHERHKALTEVQGHVFDQEAARHAVELCMLRDPLAADRKSTRLNS